MEYIEREKAVEIIKSYGKDAISKGKNTLDPVDDIILLANEVSMIPAADAVEAPHKIKTNYDRIRNMSVEEMSNFLMDWFIDGVTGNAPMNVKAWLESEATE